MKVSREIKPKYPWGVIHLKLSPQTVNGDDGYHLSPIAELMSHY